MTPDPSSLTIDIPMSTLLLIPNGVNDLLLISASSEHSAIAYYWLLIFFYLVSPKVAYNFMQRVEYHAMDTYAVFVETNKDLLATIPPPKVALNYYLNEDLYMVSHESGSESESEVIVSSFRFIKHSASQFDEFQQGNKSNPRRPKCANLLDVFTNIRDDGEVAVYLGYCVTFIRFWN